MTRVEELAWIATGRRDSLFAEDIARSDDSLRLHLNGARVLVIGGAGSIGSATLRQLVRYAPSAIHVVDLSENNLVELVRDLRCSRLLEGQEFRALPIDYGSQAMRRYLFEQPPYDFVFNFAAIKHVRSEKDVWSLLQMLDTNIVKQARLLEWLGAGNRPVRYFCVSTDKAANPVNLMGATKRFGEHIMFDAAARARPTLTATSARFANVAFSDGSLLHGWTERFGKGQPLSVPQGARRVLHFAAGGRTDLPARRGRGPR